MHGVFWKYQEIQWSTGWLEWWRGKENYKDKGQIIEKIKYRVKGLCTKFRRHYKAMQGFRLGSWSLGMVLESGLEEQENGNGSCRWLKLVLVIWKDPCLFGIASKEVEILWQCLTETRLGRHHVCNHGAWWSEEFCGPLLGSLVELRVPSTSQCPPSSSQVIGHPAACVSVCVCVLSVPLRVEKARGLGKRMACEYPMSLPRVILCAYMSSLPGHLRIAPFKLHREEALPPPPGCRSFSFL